MSAKRPALRALARRLGIYDGYRDVDGNERVTSDATREALVAAMGHDASSEATAAEATSRLERQEREQIIDPVVVWREWEGGSPELVVDLGDVDDPREYQVELQLEDGRTETRSGRFERDRTQAPVSLPLPIDPPHGYHDVHLSVTSPHAEARAHQQLVKTPRTVVQPEDVIGPGGAYGIWANLYTLRDRGDWGHGGLRELARLGSLAGELGASFVGINPLHAVTNRSLDFSPYSPSSRLYRNMLYLDPEAVPERKCSDPARALLEDPALRKRRAALEASDQIEHQHVLDLLLPVLRALHATFARDASPARKEAYTAYLEREGQTLLDFATWETLAAHHVASCGTPGTAWWLWPEPYRNPRSAAVGAFRSEHSVEVDFRCWIQFELDRQLEEASTHIRASGCALGIYQDLALGSARASADTWMAPERFAQGAHVGAPPDAYAPEGQDWGFPPFDPHRLRQEGYRPWAELLRAAFAHTGALRIDHAMGLQRLFWIPEGRPGHEGAYVAYRPDELLGVLALESQRHRSVVVAEDLGTLPPQLPGLLADWGLLRSAVVYFERDEGRFRPTTSYPPRALASVSTHDLAPLAGQFDGTDLEVRSRAGGFASQAKLAEARQERADDRIALIDALREEGFLAEEGEPDLVALRAATLAFLAATPSILVAVSLDDLAGERDPVNLPGISLDIHRSWSRRMALPLEALTRSPELRASLQSLHGRFRRARRQR